MIGENVKGTVFLFEENDCSLAPLKLHRTSYNNIGLHLSHSFMVNVLIWHIHNSNCSYLLSIVNFLEEQL